MAADMLKPMDEWGPEENAEYFRALAELEQNKSASSKEENPTEEGCKECGAPPSSLCYGGYCPECDREELEDYLADAIKTEADFQASRQ